MTKRAPRFPRAERRTAENRRSGWREPWFVAGLTASTVLLAYLCARPVGDSDLWYHMAYARQMLLNESLILDHTAFSWTPSDNSIIYCAWLAQLALYGLYELGGLPALFALRYAAFFTLIVGVVFTARRAGVLDHPLTWLLTVLALLMSPAAFNIKPNMASFVFMTLIVVLWFFIRRRGLDGRGLAYLAPVIMLLWVNTHGGFVMGLAYLALAATGELLNARFSPANALPVPVRKHVLLAVALSFLTVFVTPYWWQYPLQFFTVSLPAIDLQAVREYDTIFAPPQRALRFVEHGALMMLVIVGLLFDRVRRREIEWGLVLANVAFAVLYVYYARLTSFWAVVALFSGISLMAELPTSTENGGRAVGSGGTLGRVRAHSVGLAMTVLAVSLGVRAVYTDRVAPVVGTWQGFGNSYWNPEEEAEYIARHFPGVRVGNDYNAGGYLIWRLWPEAKVFIDARYFPYRSWFQEYLGFETTAGLPGLIDKYAADVWCVELVLGRTVAWFRASPEWTPAFYGSSAAVFVRRGTPLPGNGPQAGNSIGDIRNLHQALLVLAFAFDVRDLAAAGRIVGGMHRRFKTERERRVVATAQTAVDGLAAHQRRDYQQAVHLLSGVAEQFGGTPQAVLVESALLEVHRRWQLDDLSGAVSFARIAARFGPRQPIARYNAGITAWWLQQQLGESSDHAWRPDLEAFLAMSGSGDEAMAAAVETAKSILQRRTSARPPLLMPAIFEQDAPPLP